MQIFTELRTTNNTQFSSSDVFLYDGTMLFYNPQTEIRLSTNIRQVAKQGRPVNQRSFTISINSNFKLFLRYYLTYFRADFDWQIPTVLEKTGSLLDYNA